MKTTTIFLILFFFIFFSTRIISSAKVYYFSFSSGDDITGDGSWQKPFKSTNKAASIMEQWDKLLFKEGEVFDITARFTISKSYVYINSYKGKGVETKDFSSNRPVFDANNRALSSIVFVDIGVRNVTVKNLEIKRTSTGNAVYFNEAEYCSVEHCYLHNIFKTPISGKNSHYLRVEYCQITNGSFDYYITKTQGGSGWTGGGIQMRHGYSSHGLIARHNLLFNTWAEGIDMDDDALIEYNVIGNNGVGIYANGVSGFTIRYNLVFESDNNVLYPPLSVSSWSGPAISVTVEEPSHYRDITNGEIYGNIVIGRSSGLRISVQDGKHMDGVKWHHNTLIDNQLNFKLNKVLNVGINEEVIMRNMISYPKHSSSIHADVTNGDFVQKDFHDNIWAHTSDVNSKMLGSGDIFIPSVGFAREIWKDGGIFTRVDVREYNAKINNSPPFFNEI